MNYSCWFLFLIDSFHWKKGKCFIKYPNYKE